MTYILSVSWIYGFRKKYCDVNYMLIHAAQKRYNDNSDYTIYMFDYLISQGADAFDEAIKECKDPEIIEYLKEHKLQFETI
jgi:hypothetical protein